MKKKRKWIVAAVAIACLCGIAFAADGIVNIAVNYDTVKKIVVNHEEITPTEGEEPFEYNGRTYVPLRFVSEALGKHVSWNNSEGIVNINDVPKSTLLFESDLTDEEIWGASIGGHHVEDGAVTMSIKDIYHNSFLVLQNQYYPTDMKNFTMQVDVKVAKNNLYEHYDMGSAGGFLIGHAYNKIKMDTYGIAAVSVAIHTKEEIEEPIVKQIEEPAYMKGSSIYIPYDKYYTIKAVVEQTEDGTLIDTYVDDVLLNTKHWGMTIPEILELKEAEFSIGLVVNYNGYYFKNFKLYSND